MPNGRAKKGGQIGLNGEFYRGGVFLPSTTTRPKNISNSKAERKSQKPLLQWQIDNIKRAIEGTKRDLEANRAEWQAEGRQNAIDAHEAYIESLTKQLSDQLA